MVKDNKRVIPNKKAIVWIIVVAMILFGIYYFVNNFVEVEITNEISEYQPQQEISEEQLRTTKISLYFKNKETGELVEEAREIDVKELLNNTYINVIKMLIDSPKDDKLVSVIPEGTQIFTAELNNDILNIDFSEEFIKNHVGGKDEELKTINALVKTLGGLSEVEGIKILIGGEENLSYPDGAVSFLNVFINED